MDFKFEKNTESSTRLDKFLSSVINDISRSQIQTLIKSGVVKIADASITDCSHKLQGGETISIKYNVEKDFAKMSTAAENIPLNIVFEDDAIIVLNKPAGMTVHPAPGSPDGTLVNALMHHTKGALATNPDDISAMTFRPGIVHRIDKETSGLLVIAKTTPALIDLQKQFEIHSIHRVYTAISFGKPRKNSDRLETFVSRGVDSKKQIVVRQIKGKSVRKAITNYEAIRIFNMVQNNQFITVYRCRLETGRTHQIRVHMTYIGTPIIGDKLYGNNEKRIKGFSTKHQPELQKISRHLLHATELGFVHPITKEELFFKSELPNDMQDFINFCNENSKKEN
ncbi:MAG: RluA family pseudouridine synthase [Rickettsiales bacterium]|jgi:23S rRNA pseudouridine1911/1915/1917 synthase|nr:RluA family pseudouridine synthase [Rickettsiales bacterium]